MGFLEAGFIWIEEIVHPFDVESRDLQGRRQTDYQLFK